MTWKASKDARSRIIEVRVKRKGKEGCLGREKEGERGRQTDRQTNPG